MNTGSIQAGYPSMGSWVTYGLGTENQNLPAFVVFSDWRGGPIGGAPNWGNGFMPAAYQGTPFRSTGDPIVDLKPPKEIDAGAAAAVAGSAAQVERAAPGNRIREDTELSARIQSYELAFRMQSSRHRKRSTSNKESAATRALYGVDEKPTEYVGRQCLMARRLVERGVRFVQIFSGGGNFERELGCALGPQGEPRDALRRDRQAHRRAAHGSEEPRHCSIPRWSSGTASSDECRSRRR